MNHPKPEAIREAMALLQGVYKPDIDRVSMEECGTYYIKPQPDIPKSECGTIACHGGWYLVAKQGRKHRTVGCGAGPHPYKRGAYMLANDLGFQDSYELSQWAKESPELWGNPYGEAMFAANLAFGLPFDGKILMQDIINHWLAVADRIEALEKPKPEMGSWEEIEKTTGFKYEEPRSSLLKQYKQ